MASSLSHRRESRPLWFRKVTEVQTLTPEVQPWAPKGDIAQTCPEAVPLHRQSLGQLFCSELTNKAGVPVRARQALPRSKLHDFGQVSPFPSLSLIFPLCEMSEQCHSPHPPTHRGAVRTLRAYLGPGHRPMAPPAQAFTLSGSSWQQQTSPSPYCLAVYLLPSVSRE